MTSRRLSEYFEERHGFAGALRAWGVWGAPARPPMLVNRGI
jgi:hypothetical protein